MKKKFGLLCKTDFNIFKYQFIARYKTFCIISFINKLRTFGIPLSKILRTQKLNKDNIDKVKLNTYKNTINQNDK